MNGYVGYRVTSTINGNSIFLPAAGNRNGTSTEDTESRGFYWSSSLYTVNYPCNAWDLVFNTGAQRTYRLYRHYGFPVRPVTE